MGLCNVKAEVQGGTILFSSSILFTRVSSPPIKYGIESELEIIECQSW